MSDKLNSVQNTSYTAKDFQTIFPELLDLVSQLTNKWDPSSSNESDPGVILLKLDALIADKLNYAIDKNTLECFPLSVTQLRNARQLYNQLGYRMKWYQSATTQVSMSYSGEESSTNYVDIPAFTMVSDENTSKIYTLIGPHSEGDYHVASSRLLFDSSVISFDAIEGVALDYEINSSKDITVSNLDNNNRLYFNISDIAENGIFITNIGEDNYSSWKLKENLVTESLGNTYYTFGVSQDSNSCYIEFPEDAESIFKNGINITYIKSSGESGNITSNTLNKFYADLSLADNTDTTVVLNSDNVTIKNYSAASNGSDPETIDDAYNGYKRTIGTFDTLVTLRDYVNYIITNKLASNGFACDRNNDPQSTYSIIANLNGVSASQTMIDKETTSSGGTTNKLSAFDLKLYLLQYTDAPSTLNGFENSFTPLSNAKKQVVEAYIEDSKSISHDYASILTPTTKRSNICMIVNEYPLVCRIITKAQITDNQADDILQNVQSALFKNLNSSQLEFGESITLELLIDTITNADSRIKSVSVDNIEYTTYAVYATENASGSDITYKKVQISNMYSDEFEPAIDVVVNYNADYFYKQQAYAIGDYCIYPNYSYSYTDTVVKSTGNEQTYKNQPTIYKCSTAISRAEPFNKTKWTAVDSQEIAINSQTFCNTVGNGNYPTITVTYNTDKWITDYEEKPIEDLGISITTADTKLTSIIKSIVLRQSLSQQVYDEVYTKSVLCGATPLFKKDEEVEYGWGQSYNILTDSTYNTNKLAVSTDGSETKIAISDPFIRDVYEITTNVDISVDSSTNTYLLRNNEYLQLFYPNLIDSRAYSNYVKFEYQLNNKVSANEEYELSNDEFIAFYWKADGEDEEYYSYYVYSKGNIIKPSIELAIFNGTHTSAFNELILTDSSSTYGVFKNIGTDTSEVLVKNNTNNGSLTSTHNDSIVALTKSQFVLSGSKKVVIRKVNKIELNSAYNCYWITNSTDDFGNYKLIFNNNKVTLDTGEYFIYTNAALTDLSILGAGTTIEYTNILGSDIDYLTATKIDAEDILTKGADAISAQSAWYVPSNTVVLQAIENKYNTYNPGTTLKFEPYDKTVSTWSIKFNRNVDEVIITPDTLTLADFNISYKKSTDDDFVSIDTINLTSVKGISGRSLLTLNLSTDTEQAILKNQRVDIYQKDTDYAIRLIGANLVQEDKERYYPVALKANTSINFDGAGIKHVSYYNNTEIVYPSLYLFTKNISNSDLTLRYTTQGDASLYCVAGINTMSFNFGLPVGKYIVQFEQSSKTISDPIKVQIKEVGGTAIQELKTMYGKSLDHESITFLSMSIEKEVMYTMTVTLPEHTDDVTVTLTNPYKYDKPTNITEDYFNKIWAILLTYDINNTFNYLYQVDEADQIVDPLNPNSFFVSTHPYNNYTICKLDTTSNTNIMLMNKK